MSVIGVCSWSLQPRSPRHLVKSVLGCGVRAVQIGLKPLRREQWSESELVARLGDAGIAFRSGMLSMDGEDYTSLASIRRTGGLGPDERWPDNLAAARQSARIARRLGLPLVSVHAGFLPESRDDPARAVLLDRLVAVAELFAAEEVALALETGQESARTLLDVLAELDHPNLGVIFDPANMLLYGSGDPLAALAALAPHVRQVHVKDARPSEVPGAWGAEQPVGEGQVDWPACLALLAGAGLDVDLMIEREAGRQRVRDVARARERLEALIGSRAS
jgi:sugar phosphate isomerase/epimerase